MTYDDISSLQDELTQRLADGLMTDAEFEKEWKGVLWASGWTAKEFEDEVDRRWGFVDQVHDRAPPVRHRN